MKKNWVLSLLLCANFSLGSDADDSSNVSTPRTESGIILLSASQRRRSPARRLNPVNQTVSLMLGTVTLFTALFCVVYFNDEEVKAVKRLKIDCNEPFNKTNCYDADVGCAYRECVAKAFCLPGNCTKYTQLPDCNLNKEQKAELQHCNRWKVFKLYKNYSQEYPQGYAQQECLKKRGHDWDNYNKICRKKSCSWWNLCGRR